MQPSSLTRLGAPVQDFVRELEQRANIEIQVLPDPRLNRGWPHGQGHLEEQSSTVSHPFDRFRLNYEPRLADLKRALTTAKAASV